MSDMPPPPPPPPPGAPMGAGAAGMSEWGPLAPWGERVIAYLIDVGFFIVPVVALFIIGAIAGAIADILGTLVTLVIIAYAFAFSVYFIGWCNGLGASPGKKVRGLRVVSLKSGQPIGGGMGLVRWLVIALLSFPCFLYIPLLIDVLFPLWDNRRQTLHDKAVGTVVTMGHPPMDVITAFKSSLPGAK